MGHLCGIFSDRGFLVLTVFIILAVGHVHLGFISLVLYSRPYLYQYLEILYTLNPYLKIETQPQPNTTTKKTKHIPKDKNIQIINISTSFIPIIYPLIRTQLSKIIVLLGSVRILS